MYLQDLNFCETTSAIWQFIGYFLIALKIAIPLLLIILGIIDLSKAVVTNDNDQIKKSTKTVARRLLIGILIFFIPTIVNILFKLIKQAAPTMNEIDACKTCLLSALSDECDDYKEQARIDREARQEELNNATIKINYKCYKCSSLYKWSNIKQSGCTVVEELDTEEKCEALNGGNGNNDNNEVTVDPTKIENLRQGDSRWANYPVCMEGKTISTSGCGYVSYTMILRRFGNNETMPPELVDIACNELDYGLSAVSYDVLVSNEFNDKYGLKVETIAHDYTISDPEYGKKYLDEVKKALKDGKALIVLIPGHYITILGINDDDTIIVGDPGRGYESTDKYTVESLYETTKGVYDTSNSYINSCQSACGWTIILAYSKK